MLIPVAKIMLVAAAMLVETGEILEEQTGLCQG
jgi:hypothetical protein